MRQKQLFQRGTFPKIKMSEIHQLVTLDDVEEKYLLLPSYATHPYNQEVCGSVRLRCSSYRTGEYLLFFTKDRQLPVTGLLSRFQRV